MELLKTQCRFPIETTSFQIHRLDELFTSAMGDGVGIISKLTLSEIADHGRTQHDPTPRVP